jgi:glucose/arabinose dehydrogenase
VFSKNYVQDRVFFDYQDELGAGGTNFFRVGRQVVASTGPETVASSRTTLRKQFQFNQVNTGRLLAFDSTGNLLIGVSDSITNVSTGAQPQGQNVNSLFGKILRIDPNIDDFPADANNFYAIPPGNPFATSGGAGEVFALGLRNPYRGSVDPVTGDLFVGDRPAEINRLPTSATPPLNYGWNVVSGNTPSAGFTLPVAVCAATPASSNCDNVVGGVVYRGPIEDLQGQYIFADATENNFWTVPASSLVLGSSLTNASFTSRTAAFTPDVGTLQGTSAISADDEGNVYFIKSSTNEIFRLEPLP